MISTVKTCSESEADNLDYMYYHDCGGLFESGAWKINGSKLSWRAGGLPRLPWWVIMMKLEMGIKEETPVVSDKAISCLSDFSYAHFPQYKKRMGSWFPGSRAQKCETRFFTITVRQTPFSQPLCTAAFERSVANTGAVGGHWKERDVMLHVVDS